MNRYNPAKKGQGMFVKTPKGKKAKVRMQLEVFGHTCD